MKASIGTHNKVELFIESPRGDRHLLYHNITCTAGRTEIASRLLDSTETASLAVLQSIKLGDGTTAATENDTDLENTLATQAIDTSISEQNGKEVVVYSKFPVGSEIIFQEAGLYISSGLVLLARSVFPASVTKADDEAVTVKWTVNVNNLT